MIRYMTNELDSLNSILHEIGNELASLISRTANNANEKINIKKLAQNARKLDDVIPASGLSEGDKTMLQKFSSTLVQDNATVNALRYEKQDLERVLSNINDA